MVLLTISGLIQQDVGNVVVVMTYDKGRFVSHGQKIRHIYPWD